MFFLFDFFVITFYNIFIKLICDEAAQPYTKNRGSARI